MSFLGLEGLHVFVTGAAGGIGSAAVDEFLSKVHLTCYLPGALPEDSRSRM
jgi:NAD(P)-dependent dehydrogenase (short-subunit alcohol dehydrogenase family)